MNSEHLAIWAIVSVSIAGVLFRPFRVPEVVWSCAGAAALVASCLLPWREAGRAVVKGVDVYLFLSGMMLLAELARESGLFDWLAALAARQARGSGTRLFHLTYLVGTVVTVFLSNDATAVVLTPAVAAVAKAARAADPLPYLLICAFVANAASFVLPISNPANLVVYGSDLPELLSWVLRFALPSLLAIGATFVALWFTQRSALRQPIATTVALPRLSSAGWLAAVGICANGALLMLASMLKWQLGPPTALVGLATAAAIVLPRKGGAVALLRQVSWGVLPLVAGLFVLVRGLERSGLVDTPTRPVRLAATGSQGLAFWGIGGVLAVASNAMNNLPVGLMAGEVLDAAKVSAQLKGAALVGVDLGPNLSVTGSLATILWLVALRREGHHVSARTFLKLGAVVMPPALLLALAGLWFTG